jgi:hypothetical protein
MTLKQIRDKVASIGVAIEIIFIVAFISFVVVIMSHPSLVGELAACWFDTFMISFTENIKGTY